MSIRVFDPGGISRIQDATDANLTLGAGTDGYHVAWDNDASEFVLTPDATGIDRIQDATDANLTLGAGTDGYALTWDNDTLKFVLAAMSGGVTDHGALTGLSDDDHTQYRKKFTNWLLVDPAGKGDYTTISAALAAVSSPTSSNRWLVDVMPGSYDENITIPAYTTVRSITPRAAVLTKTGSLSDNAMCLMTGTGGAIDGMTFQNLTLNNTCVAIYVDKTCEIRNCNIYLNQSSGSGKTIRGIWMLSGATSLLVQDTDIDIRADGNAAHGISNHSAHGPIIRRCKIQTTAYTGGSAHAVGYTYGVQTTTIIDSIIDGITGYAFDAGSGTIQIDRCRYSGSITGTVVHVDRTTQSNSDATRLPVSASQTPLILKGYSGQTAMLQQWQDSGGNVVFGIEADGDIRTAQASTNTNTPSGATAYKLPIYNASGTLLGYIPIYGSAW